MTIQLTNSKKEKLLSLIKAILAPAKVWIREVAQVIGHIVSSLPAVEFGPLYCRKLEKDKTLALSQNKSNFESFRIISDESKAELKWWLKNVKDSFKYILSRPVDIVLYSNASLICWGGPP